MKSNLLSKSESSTVLKEISTRWKIELVKTKNLKVHHIFDDAQLIIGEGFIALKVNGEYIPFLSQIKILEKFPNVMVDMGAVKFMCKGANVMRPGIKNFTEFEKDQIVCVIEESQHKFLAIGKAMVPSNEMESIEKGEVLKNLHYISDRFWEIAKTITN